jgi:hypothetical protein
MEQVEPEHERAGGQSPLQAVRDNIHERWEEGLRCRNERFKS